MVNNNQETFSLMLKAINSMKNCDLFDSAVNFIRDTNGLESQNIRKVFLIGFLIKLRVRQDVRCNDSILVDFINDKSVILEINLPTEHFRLKVCMYDSTGQEMLVVNELSSFTTEPRNRIVVTAPLLNCPYVTLDAGQFCQLYKRNITSDCPSHFTEQSFDKFVTVLSPSGNLYRICVADYIIETFKFVERDSDTSSIRSLAITHFNELILTHLAASLYMFISWSRYSFR